MLIVITKSKQLRYDFASLRKKYLINFEISEMKKG